jgi:hypothetical protein
MVGSDIIKPKPKYAINMPPKDRKASSTDVDSQLHDLLLLEVRDFTNRRVAAAEITIISGIKNSSNVYG